MSEMIINSILIADVIKKKAHFQSFTKGLNVVTGSDNHVGKSSLLKSLYHTLGANVDFDSIWDINSKLFALDFSVNGTVYRIARFMDLFAVFQGEQLVLFTDSTTKELAPLLEKIYTFGVYLNDKNSDKLTLAPPAFTYLPYYIDQDNGWVTLYESFQNLGQFKKDARMQSLYYHLNVYTKESFEMMVKRDRLKERAKFLSKERTRLAQVISAMTAEIEGVVPADNMEELEQNLHVQREVIKELISTIGKKRNVIQEIEISLEQHKQEQNAILHHRKATPDESSSQLAEAHMCPRCGYLFDEEIYERVHTQYLNINDVYIQQHLEQSILALETSLQNEKESYLELLNELKSTEKSFSEESDGLEVYIRHKGLSKSIGRYSQQLGQNDTELHKNQSEQRKISRYLNKLPNKKEVEDKYIEFTRLNIMRLRAWNPAYDGKIHLLVPIKAQGTLENKIILSQFVGLFQTMDFFKSPTIRFPFVVDSPRGKEASQQSSIEILSLIANISILPQIILATVDFEDYKEGLGDSVKNANVITLTRENALLDEHDYSKFSDEIEKLYSMFVGLSQNM